MDYLVTEAIIMKAGRERQEHEENEKRKAWRKDHQALVSKSAGMGKL